MTVDKCTKLPKISGQLKKGCKWVEGGGIMLDIDYDSINMANL